MNRKAPVIFVTAILALVFVVGAGAQTPSKPANLPSAADIVKKYVQAIGGADNIKKTTSRVSKGTLEIAAVGLNGTAEVFEKAPNKTATFVNITNFGTVQEGFDGTAAWSQDPQSGLRDKTGSELAAAKL